MKSKLLVNDADAFERAHVMVCEVGDDCIRMLEKFAADAHISAASFSGIGAFSECQVAFYDLNEKEYKPIPVNEQVEVLSLNGNVSKHEGSIKIHAHAVLGRRDGSTIGGHLLSGVVMPTLEIFIHQYRSTLTRTYNEEIGLPLLD